MNNNPYILNPISDIKADLKIFFGKKDEINDLRTKNKIVPNKWYLAWDTGEIFIASPTRVLIKFGGNSGELSKEEIIDLINNTTEEEVSLLKAQIGTMNETYSNISNEMTELSSTVESTLTQVNNTLSLLDNFNGITNVSEYITNIVNTLIDNDNTIENNTFVTKNSLNSILMNYAQTSDIDNINRVKYVSGNELSNITTNGVYVCTSDSGKYTTGSIYLYSNNNLYDISNASSQDVEISIDILNSDGTATKELIFGDSFVGDKVCQYRINKPLSISDNLKLYVNTSAIPITTINNSDIMNYGEIEFISDLTDLSVGTYKFTLSGLDKNNNLVTGTYSIDVKAPLFYLNSQSNTVNGISITNATNYSTKIANRYTMNSINYGDYIWLISPVRLENNYDIELNGYKFPFDLISDSFEVTLGNVRNRYYAYRSSLNMIQMDLLTFKIVE